MGERRRINLRMNEEETGRWKLVMGRIQARMPRNVKIPEATVIRELLGLLPPVNVTETERLILSHGTEYPRARPDQVPGGRRKRDVG